ncbi:NAD(P)-dependent oxidoreductase [Ruegeria sp. WL0004]|uniref:NAD(P)-dependent oxidoreductase n=1 Tax=Ruegeria marisflavi TaxID=2984152 RepID=A0ABT2WWA6_9RHOB|nr:NAD(P)-dependent oxidoreductase [Ruegeria sp. WL0004]MCU9840184.1 NAD(P)-dependent oxidoreductase [Ruegeria sp. WL0004]
MQIGFLGTGLMGAHMVRNLLKAGHIVTVWNRTAAKAEALAADGATVAASPDRAVVGAEMVISMLADGPATEAILSDPALRQALSPGSTWVDMSSAKPEESRAHARDLATLGVAHLDAPVSGGTLGAEAGTLAIMAGGAAETFDCARPVLEAMGRPVLVGPGGSGQLAKLANQAVVAITISAVAEAMLLLERGGADPAAVRDALKGGFADSTILQQHGARMSARDFAPGGLTRLQIKDLDNVLGEAASLGLTLPATQETRRRFVRLADKMVGGELDHSALFMELCDLNQLETGR